jgi:ABC-type amino acid transport substrate-binding protein
MSANRNFWARSGIGVFLVVTAIAARQLGAGRSHPPDAIAAAQPNAYFKEGARCRRLRRCRAVHRRLDGMIERRMIRVLTVQNPVLYFVDRGREVGMTYEMIKAFEERLNKRLGNKVVTVHVIAIPVARDELIPRLLAGQGDFAAAQLTITPERQQQVDFSSPFATGVREVLVTAPRPPVASLETCWVRRSTSAFRAATPSTCGSSTPTSRPRASRR